MNLKCDILVSKCAFKFTLDHYAEDLMTMCKPEIVCICAGRTWVDGCESEVGAFTS